jgi:hypothetical protein
VVSRGNEGYAESSPVSVKKETGEDRGGGIRKEERAIPLQADEMEPLLSDA